MGESPQNQISLNRIANVIVVKDGVTYKKCTGRNSCGGIYPLNNFRLAKNGVYGTHNTCKTCYNNREKHFRSIKLSKPFKEKYKSPHSKYSTQHKILDDKTELKLCEGKGGCNEWKPLSSFKQSSSTWDGRNHVCYSCLYKKQINRKKIDLDFKLRTEISAAIRQGCSRNKGLKKSTLEVLLGCSIPDFKKHIESLWEPWMNWTNYGHKKGTWNYDHITPLSSFDLSDANEQKKAFNYKNVRPLDSIENYIKHDKIITNNQNNSSEIKLCECT
jgi:hypothetical protein